MIDEASNKLGLAIPALPARSVGRPPGATSRLITSEALLAGCRELLIEHAGSLYRMRVTQQNKLILTK